MYPDLKIPNSKDVSLGSLRQGSMCLDTLGNMVDGHVGIYTCHGTGGNQVTIILCYFSYVFIWILNPWSSIQSKYITADLVYIPPQFYLSCETLFIHWKFQEWSLTKSGNIKHSDLCLSVVSAEEGERVELKICDNSQLQVNIYTFKIR